MVSQDPSYLEGSGIREMPLNCYLPSIPLMLFPFVENLLVLTDLIAWREGDRGQSCLCGRVGGLRRSLSLLL